jgi:predicted TIM-barrel fold metal-dependent hydrolase
MKSFNIVNAHIHFESIPLIEETKLFFQTLGIVRVNVLSYATLEKVNSNPQALCLKARYPEDVYISGGLDYSEIDRKLDKDIEKLLGDQVVKLKEIGFDGIKILETKPDFAKKMPFPIDSPVYTSFFSFIEESGLPIFWHVADPEEFWDREKLPKFAKEMGWDYTDGSYPTKEELYQRVDNILKRFPNLKVIFAHFYFLSADLKRASELLDRYPNVNLDITPGSEMYYNFSVDPKFSRDFFIKYQDRIIFGDDTEIVGEDIEKDIITNRINFIRTFLETGEEFLPGSAYTAFLGKFGKIRGIKLPDSVLEKIYSQNFLRLVGDKPSLLDLSLAKEECFRIGNILETKYKYPKEANFGYQAGEFLESI